MFYLVPTIVGFRGLQKIDFWRKPGSPLDPGGRQKITKVLQKALPGRAGSPSGKGPRFSSLRGLPRSLKTSLFLKENHTFQRVRLPAKGIRKGSLKPPFCSPWGASGAENASKGPSRKTREKHTEKNSEKTRKGSRKGTSGPAGGGSKENLFLTFSEDAPRRPRGVPPDLKRVPPRPQKA